MLRPPMHLYPLRQMPSGRLASSCSQLPAHLSSLGTSDHLSLWQFESWVLTRPLEGIECNLICSRTWSSLSTVCTHGCQRCLRACLCTINHRWCVFFLDSRSTHHWAEKHITSGFAPIILPWYICAVHCFWINNNACAKPGIYIIIMVPLLFFCKLEMSFKNVWNMDIQPKTTFVADHHRHVVMKVQRRTEPWCAENLMKCL